MQCVFRPYQCCQCSLVRFSEATVNGPCLLSSQTAADYLDCRAARKLRDLEAGALETWPVTLTRASAKVRRLYLYLAMGLWRRRYRLLLELSELVLVLVPQCIVRLLWMFPVDFFPVETL